MGYINNPTNSFQRRQKKKKKKDFIEGRAKLWACPMQSSTFLPVPYGFSLTNSFL